MSGHSSRYSIKLTIAFLSWLLKGRKTTIKEEVEKSEIFFANKINLIIVFIGIFLIFVLTYLIIQFF